MLLASLGMASMRANSLSAVFSGGVYDDIIEKAGGENSFPSDTPDPELTSNLSPEALASADVDVLVVGLTDPSEEPKVKQLAGIMFWLMGSLAGAEWSDLRLPTAALVLGTVWLFTQGRSLNALLAGDDAAAGLGVDVHRLRRRLLVVTSLMTATVVVVAGGLGFVGLVIPHIVRLAVGAEHRRVLPTSMLVGAVFLVLVDLASRTVARPGELPVGIFTAGIGVPVLLWLLRRTSRPEGT